MSSSVTRSNPISNEDVIDHTPLFRLPQEIVEDILGRLPPKYLIKFSCLSKRCKSVIFDPEFVQHYRTSTASNLHGLFFPMIESITVPSRGTYKHLMLCKELKRPDLGALDGLLFYLSTGFSRSEDSCEFDHNIVASSNGLILSLFHPRRHQFEYCVSNPLTNQSVRLPPVPCREWQWQSGFATLQKEINGAYHVSYKVVLFSSPKSSPCCTAQIFSSDTGCWTSPISGLPKLIKSDKSGQDFCHRGILYWWHNGCKTIVTYDPWARPDRFGSIRLPDVGLHDSHTQTGISLVQLGQEDLVRYCAIKQHSDSITLLVWLLVQGKWWLQLRCPVSPLCYVENWFPKYCWQLVALETSKTSLVPYMCTALTGDFIGLDLQSGKEINVSTCEEFPIYAPIRAALVSVVFCPWASPFYCQLNYPSASPF